MSISAFLLGLSLLASEPSDAEEVATPPPIPDGAVPTAAGILTEQREIEAFVTVIEHLLTDAEQFSSVLTRSDVFRLEVFAVTIVQAKDVVGGTIEAVEVLGEDSLALDIDVDPDISSAGLAGTVRVLAPLRTFLDPANAVGTVVVAPRRKYDRADAVAVLQGTRLRLGQQAFITRAGLTRALGGIE